MPVQTRDLMLACCLLAVGTFTLCVEGAIRGPKGETSPWAEWVEPGFPFYSSVVDARQKEHPQLKSNLTPRGLVFPLGEGLQVCFDVDLLRVSAIWQGEGLTPEALAPHSYHPWGTKTQGGQSKLPQPIGKVWFGNGLYPGWQTGNPPVLKDPRIPAPSPEEPGRGPLPSAMGKFQAIRLQGDSVVIEYEVYGTPVREWFTAEIQKSRPMVVRHLEVSPTAHALNLMAGIGSGGSVSLTNRKDIQRLPRLEHQGDLAWVHLPSGKQSVQFSISYSPESSSLVPSIQALPKAAPKTRWPETIVTAIHPSTSRESHVVDPIDLPYENPWKRNVRPADFQFLPDGSGVLVTLDGDIWRTIPIQESDRQVRWKRFASGLHEPMTAAIREGVIHVFDKNGIWQLLDTNDDGEADVHRLFSNAFAQTADMREFPSTIRLAPDGGFVIAKGGQQASTLGKHNGSVLKISADGQTAEVLGYGFRQPNIGVHPKSGLVTSSDQEGQYIPTTPLHIVEGGHFYGYLAEGLQEREQYPETPAEPLTWMPHAVNASAISQVWLFGAKLGPLNDGLVHIGFNRPELFQILMHERASRPQAAVVSVTTAFPYPPLNGSVNPLDGALYIAGFQVPGWGNALDTLTGLGRVRYTGTDPVLPVEVVAMDKGLLLRFATPLDPETATRPESYSISTWHYKRTYRYGSPQYREDGSTGIDWHAASSAYLSRDRKSVFVGMPDMKPVMQMRIGWSLRTAQGRPFERNAYTTIHELVKFQPVKEGFDKIQVDLTPRAMAAQAAGEVSVEEGHRLYQLMGCVACHSTSGLDVAKVGPTWTGLHGSQREVVIGKKRTQVLADAAYLRESILDPAAKVVRSYEKGEYAMPSYAGVLSDSQVDSLILFIEAVKKENPFSPGTPATAPAPKKVSFE